VPTEVEPPELARLLDTAERPREGGWSLRSALARYAQSQPKRMGDVLEALRRTQGGLRPHMKRLRREGHEVWAQVEAAVGDEPEVGLLLVMVELDGLGDRLATWAQDPTTPRPDEEVDAVVASVSARLEELGIPRETRDLRAREPRRRRSSS
jgi:hypothetical protein